MAAEAIVVKRLPIWALTIISLVLVAYIGVLGGVAIMTERDVKLWPPEIGQGPKSKLVDEFKEARKVLQEIKLGMTSELRVLDTRLHEARTKRALTYEDNILESMRWEDVEQSIIDDRANYEKIFFSKITELEDYIKSIEQQVKSL